MANLDKRPRGSGEWCNGAKPLDTAVLLAHGLTVVRHLNEHGKVCGETVLASDDVPPAWLAPFVKPNRPCGACGQDLWRLDRTYQQGWLCGRCHP